MANFKIVLDAGHGINTAGKRCLKSIDPKETREWVINARICDKVENYLKSYTGYQLLRVDDTTGKSDISLTTRVKNANNFGANIYISVHHNAGVNGGKGGGVVAISCVKPDNNTKQWRNELYNAIVNSTGLKGNRSAPLVERSDLYVLNKTKMAAVLLECGFMDSTTDTPIILTDAFADNVAKAIVDVIVKRGVLTKKATQSTPTQTTPTPQPTQEKIKVTYQVWDDTRNAWLPNVVDVTDYAGIIGHNICCVYANLSKGNIYYKVHTKGGKWLPEVKNRSDYAGIYNKPIDAIMFKTDTGKTIRYAVHVKKSNKWLPFVTGYNTNDNNNGYAGIIGQEIDAIKMYVE